MRKKIIKFFLHISGVILFVFATSYALLAAYGYQIDLLQRNIVKTSIVDIANVFNGVNIQLDGEKVADKAPYQIKNISPGSHLIQISKKGFLPWKRKIEVNEDIVTKIDDVLLIPKDLTEFKNEIEINFNFEKVIFNERLIVFISAVENKIHIYTFNNDASFDIQHINYKLDEIPDEVYFADQNHLAFADNETVVLLDLRDNSLITVLIPDEFSNFKVAYTPGLKGFYINENRIYTVSIGDNGTFNEIIILDEKNENIYEDLNLYRSSDQIFLVANNVLYKFSNNELEKIDEKVISKAYVNPNGASVLYIKEGGQIIQYKYSELNKEMLGRFASGVNDLYWYSDGKHFYLIQDELIMLCDLDFSNCGNIQKNTDSFVLNPNVLITILDESIMEVIYLRVE